MNSYTAKEICAILSHATCDSYDQLYEQFSSDPRKQVQNALISAQKRCNKEQHERNRVRGMYSFQREVAGSGIILGVDEVGRGSIAGPLTVSAVALPDQPYIWGLNDSKKITPIKRTELAQQIRNCALAIGIFSIPPHEIDEFGMSVCIRKAMLGAIEASHIEPDCVLIDGVDLHIHPKERYVVQGDSKCAAIAAASIIAKTYRDLYMTKISAEYPAYGFDQHKGYGSEKHIDAIKQFGLSPLHRKTFCTNFM